MSLDKAKVLTGKDIITEAKAMSEEGIIKSEIVMKQPTVGEVIDFGEQEFFSTFHSLCSVPSDMKSTLWDINIDWNKMSDWELFINISRGITKESTSIIFGELDFSEMQLMQRTDTDEIVLANDNLIIDEQAYLLFIDNLREMIGYTLKREKAKNKVTKLAMIEEDRIKKKMAMKKNSEFDSFICTAIISLVNTEEFPYTYKSVLDITIYQLMKSFYQIQSKKAACALYQGSMSGFVDTSKINSKNFQWIYTNEKKS